MSNFKKKCNRKSVVFCGRHVHLLGRRWCFCHFCAADQADQRQHNSKGSKCRKRLRKKTKLSENRHPSPNWPPGRGQYFECPPRDTAGGTSDSLVSQQQKTNSQCHHHDWLLAFHTRPFVFFVTPKQTGHSGLPCCFRRALVCLSALICTVLQQQLQGAYARERAEAARTTSGGVLGLVQCPALARSNTAELPQAQHQRSIKVR